MKLRFLRHNTSGNLDIILGAIIIAITLAISVVVVFNVISSLDTSSLDSDVATARGENTTTDKAATNATDDLLTNLETFYTIAPILLIVLAAVGILSYVILLRR